MISTKYIFFVSLFAMILAGCSEPSHSNIPYNKVISDLELIETSCYKQNKITVKDNNKEKSYSISPKDCIYLESHSYRLIASGYEDALNLTITTDGKYVDGISIEK